jgi:hypothetical protein
MSLKEIQRLMGIEEEYMGDYNPLEDKSAEQDIFSQRHAHYGLCIHK